MPLKCKKLLILTFLFTSLFGNCQEVKVTGLILDTNQTPIEGATIIIYNDQKKITKYTISDQQGKYTITGDFKSGNFMEISFLSYEKQRRILNENDLSANTISLDFILKVITSQLDEVIILSDNKEKDTIGLDLKKLNLKDNDNLDEILKKIPNFNIGEDGTIIYKGKNINKILVNNKESFENQNSIALKNIETRIIEGIDIINNYQDDFNLDFDITDESVLNIDTKTKFKNIITGSIEGKYGFRNSYRIKGNAFLFSRGLNAFLTNNTNNIGNTTVNYKEIKKIFGDDQPFSIYQANVLNSLFQSNENLKKDFFSSTNLTLRNQSKNLKTSGLFYYITPDRISSTINNIATLQNEPIYKSTNETRVRSNSFLGAFSAAYKLPNNTIASYKVNMSFIDNKDNSFTRNQFFTADSRGESNEVFSNNFNDIFSTFNQLSFAKKINTNLIVSAKSSVYDETSKVLNSYFISRNAKMDITQQNYKYVKNVYNTNVSLNYRHSDKLVYSFKGEMSKTVENITDRDVENNSLVNRNLSNLLAEFSLKGKQIIKSLDYTTAIGLMYFDNGNSAKQKISKFFPYNVSLEYEKKLSRISFEISNERYLNSLNNSINRIRPFARLVSGLPDFPLRSRLKTYNLGYYYNNLFDALSYSLSLSYKDKRNSIRSGFEGQENGVSSYRSFIATKSNEFKISGGYSKTFLQSIYPLKADIDLDIKTEKYPLLINLKEVNAATNSFVPGFQIESITEHFFNYRLSYQMQFIEDKVGTTNYSSKFNIGRATILMKNENWKGAIEYIYNLNNINNINYKRENINLSVAYNLGKIILSLEARHLFELFSIFENDSYNTKFSVNEGIKNTIINNESLRYFILGAKYNL